MGSTTKSSAYKWVKTQILMGQRAPDNTIAEMIQSLDGSLYMYLAYTLAMERNPGTANQYGVGLPEWNILDYNPHTSAAVGTLTAGTAGNVEVLVNTGPTLLGGILWYGDTAAGSVYLYDKAATGGSGIPRPFLYNAAFPEVIDIGGKFQNGLTIIGTAAGIGCMVLWRPQ